MHRINLTFEKQCPPKAPSGSSLSYHFNQWFQVLTKLIVVTKLLVPARRFVPFARGSQRRFQFQPPPDM